MKLGFSTWAMPDLPIDTSVRELAALGFQGIEITVIPPYSTELDTLDAAERLRIRRLYDDFGVEMPAVAGHASLLAEGDGHAENWPRLTKAADLCVDFAGP